MTDNVIKNDYEKYNERVLNEVIIRHGAPSNNKFINHYGERHTRLIIGECVGTDKHRETYYMCKCDCGNEKIICYSTIRSGKAKSCGCLRKEVASKKASTHRLTGSKIYIIHQNMKRRCTDPKNIGYIHYGGRGITICEEWLGKNGFINFYNWAINNGYEDGLTIDRIDVDGNYCPENCRWATQYEQVNNTTRNHYITCGFFTLPISIWAKITRLDYSVISTRINQYNWNPLDAICTPSGKSPGEEYIIPVVPEKFMKFNKYNKFHK